MKAIGGERCEKNIGETILLKETEAVKFDRVIKVDEEKAGKRKSCTFLGEAGESKQ